MSSSQEINISTMPEPMKGRYNLPISLKAVEIERNIMDARNSGMFGQYSFRDHRDGSISAYAENVDLDVFLSIASLCPRFDLDRLGEELDHEKYTIKHFALKEKIPGRPRLASIFVRYKASEESVVTQVHQRHQ